MMPIGIYTPVSTKKRQTNVVVANILFFLVRGRDALSICVIQHYNMLKYTERTNESARKLKTFATAMYWRVWNHIHIVVEAYRFAY